MSGSRAGGSGLTWSSGDLEVGGSGAAFEVTEG